MAIITVSREIGSGGAEISMMVAKMLNYQLIDKELVSETAKKYGVLEERLQQIDETKPGLLERFDAETRTYLAFLQSTLYDSAEKDNVVILGRGGQVLLRNVKHTLKVRITAPFELRAKRIIDRIVETSGEKIDFKAASDIISRSDSERSGRMRYLYDEDWQDPKLHDIVINTEKISNKLASEIIVQCVKSEEFLATNESRKVISDLSLASRVKAALVANSDTRRYKISVVADGGVIILEGVTIPDSAIDIAKGIRGVIEVRCERIEIPLIPPFIT